MGTLMPANTDVAQFPTDPLSSLPLSKLTSWKSLPFSTFLFLFYFLLAICQLSEPQKTILQFLCHLLPITLLPNSSYTSSKVMKKVKSDFDYFLPFHQLAPSLANAWREIYADLDQLASPTGVGLFNILAFQGVFSGHPLHDPIISGGSMDMKTGKAS